MNFRTLLLALTLPVMMTGCGVVAAFIPSIAVDDPFGVEGQTVTTTFGDSAVLTGVQTQAESTAEETTSQSFDDQDFDLRGFSLARLTAKIGFDPSVTLSAPVTGAEFPAQFTLTRVAATATVTDAAHEPAIIDFERELGLRFELDRSSCTLSSCRYRFAGDAEDLANALEISESDRGLLRSFVDVIRLDGANTPNEGRFKLTLTADSDPALTGFSASFTLRSGDASIKLGG